MRHTLVLSFLAVAALAAADIDHSQLVNFPGGHATGGDLSQVESGETIFGYGFQAGSRNTMADDFTVGAGGFIMTGISVFGYTTNATAPSITSVDWAVGAAPTKTLTNSAVPTQWWARNPLGVYRTNLGDTTSTARRIQHGFVSGLNTFLAPGTYFLSVEATGVNFTPPLPTSLATHGMNALQSIGAAGAFNPVTNGAGGADLAFIIHGRVVPEPASMIALGMGAAALLARRRRK